AGQLLGRQPPRRQAQTCCRIGFGLFQQCLHGHRSLIANSTERKEGAARADRREVIPAAYALPPCARLWLSIGGRTPLTPKPHLALATFLQSFVGLCRCAAL